MLYRYLPDKKRATLIKSGSFKWLPGLDTKRTNSRIVSEVLPYHYRYCKKTKTLVRGSKPKFVPKDVVVSKKAMKHYLHVEAYENPIEKALEFSRIMKEEKLTQAEMAKKLGISRVRVTQTLNLLKLPLEEREIVLQNGKREFITERSLRKIISH